MVLGFWSYLHYKGLIAKFYRFNLIICYLAVVSVIQHIDTKIFNLKKIINNEEIIIANKSHIYSGIYNGSMRTVDQEAKGILQYTLPELKKEMEQSPNSFTHDIVFYLKNYKKEFEDFIKIIAE